MKSFTYSEDSAHAPYVLPVILVGLLVTWLTAVRTRTRP